LDFSEIGSIIEIGKSDEKYADFLGGYMFSTFFYPYSWTYLLVKIVVLAIAVLLWFMLTTAPVI
jgi:hypothetical protein